MLDIQAIESALPTIFANSGMSGMAVAIVEQGAIIYQAAFGQGDAGPLTVETPFQVASLSKMIFAYGALQLADQGLYDLDTPLSHYLPTPYIEDEPQLGLITARHLLTHSSGFPNWRSEQGLRTQFEVGSAYLYSTEGLIYLQTVIEHLLQQPFSEYAKTHLFHPFGMTKSQFLPSDLSVFAPYLPNHLESFAAISLQTTAPDYARFLQAVLQSKTPTQFHLTPATRAAMLTLAIPVGDQQNLFWGLGVGLQYPQDLPASFWHWGARQAQTRNFAMGIPETGSGVVILVNHANGLTLCEAVVQLLYPAPEGYPAFKWLLPSEQWRGDGKRPLAS